MLYIFLGTEGSRVSGGPPHYRISGGINNATTCTEHILQSIESNSLRISKCCKKSIPIAATFVSPFKQFVVTNCSKERPGSIVTKTLKN